MKNKNNEGIGGNILSTRFKQKFNVFVTLFFTYTILLSLLKYSIKTSKGIHYAR